MYALLLRNVLDVLVLNNAWCFWCYGWFRTVCSDDIIIFRHCICFNFEKSRYLYFKMFNSITIDESSLSNLVSNHSVKTVAWRVQCSMSPVEDLSGDGNDC